MIEKRRELQHGEPFNRKIDVKSRIIFLYFMVVILFFIIILPIFYIIDSTNKKLVQ